MFCPTEVAIDYERIHWYEMKIRDELLINFNLSLAPQLVKEERITEKNSTSASVKTKRNNNWKKEVDMVVSL